MPWENRRRRVLIIGIDLRCFKAERFYFRSGRLRRRLVNGLRGGRDLQKGHFHTIGIDARLADLLHEFDRQVRRWGGIQFQDRAFR